jgi:two-component system response regulator YesN
MWNILLVEDEELVKQQLKQQIPWESYGFRVAGEASHGAEALEMIDRLKPDLVISDIIMPGMDGLQLLKEATARKFDGCFIMLTCMNEFEYARQALELGAIGYCLKLSVTPERISEILMKANQYLLQRSTQKTRSFFGDIQPWLELIWNQIVTSTYNQLSETESSILYMEEVHPEFMQETVTICSILHGEAKITTQDLLHWQVLKHNIKPLVYTFSRMGHTTFFIRNPDQFQFYKSPSLPYPAVICLKVSLGKLALMWKQALLELTGFWYDPRPGIYHVIEDSISANKGDAYFSWSLERTLFAAFENLQREQTEARLVELWECMQNEHTPMYHVKKTAERVYHTCMRIAKCYEEDHSLTIWESYSHKELLDSMLSLLNQLLQSLATQKSLTTDHPDLNRLLLFMQQNYSLPLTLQQLASHINMEKHYLSGLFKKKTSQSIMLYLHHIRIEHAKQYLTDTKLPITVIAEKTGFSSTNYFIKAFRKTLGCTPVEYRKSNPTDTSK